MDALVEERRHEQRHADERVPRQRERGKIPPREVRDFVDEQDGAVQGEDGQQQQRRAKPARLENGQDERGPADCRTADEIRPVDRRRGPKPLDRNRANGLVDRALRTGRLAGCR